MSDSFEKILADKPSELWDELKTGDGGLIPCIVQDGENGQVLMLAYMNQESFNLSLETGYMHYYSRSRKALWKKGESSGNLQILLELKLDCDKDTFLAIVKQKGPACHTGRPSCFYREIEGGKDHE